MTAPIALRARFVFPVDGPPIADGVISIHDGRIIGVGRDAAAAKPIDLGNAAIIPGLVNAHTHLEFSNLSNPLATAGAPFADWIRAVIAYRRGQPPELRSAAVDAGLAECSRTGTTLLGEIATRDWATGPFQDAAPRLSATIFLELLSLASAGVEANLESADRHAAVSTTADDLVMGLSPHAPYTVHPRLLHRAVEISAEKKIPLAMHLAESPAELELLRTGGGPLRALLEELSAWEDSAIPRGSRPLDYLRALAAADRALVIHGNYLDDEEITFVADHRERMSVVYCPRTHAYFGHDPYPLSKLLTAGARVALGTDSRASNPDLNLLDEIRHVAHHHPISAATALTMGTLCGAEALGRAETTGSLTPKKFADLAIVQLPEIAAADPHEILLDPRSTVKATVYRGRVCFGDFFGHFDQ